MVFDYSLAALVAIGLLAYLLFALLHPERFRPLTSFARCRRLVRQGVTFSARARFHTGWTLSGHRLGHLVIASIPPSKSLRWRQSCARDERGCDRSD